MIVPRTLGRTWGARPVLLLSNPAMAQDYRSGRLRNIPSDFSAVPAGLGSHSHSGLHSITLPQTRRKNEDLHPGGLAVGCRSSRAFRRSGFPQFENEDVKVWKSVVMPNAPLTMHRHDHPRVIIAFSGGTMKIVDQQGKSEEHVWETGKAYWLPARSARRHARRRQRGR